MAERGGLPREDDAECGAGAAVLDPDLPTMGLDRQLAEGEAQPPPRALLLAPRLDKPLEDALAKLGGDPLPSVDDPQVEAGVRGLGVHADGAARGRVADGVVHE